LTSWAELEAIARGLLLLYVVSCALLAAAFVATRRHVLEHVSTLAMEVALADAAPSETDLPSVAPATEPEAASDPQPAA